MAGEHQCHCGRRSFLQRLAALATGALLLPGWARADAGIQDGVRYLEGEVRINGQPARLGQLLQPGDELHTGADGHLVAQMGKDAFRLRPNSRLQLEADALDGLIGALRLLNGGILAVFGKGRRRLVRTPVITAGIRGTAVYTEADAVSSYFCLCYGEVDVSAQRNGVALPQRVIAAGHHFGLSTDAAAADGLAHAPMRGHSDEELVALEAVVGRVPEFLRRREE